MSEQRLDLEEIVVDYGGGPVVHGASLSVGRGEILALLGANGSGRSSTLRAAAGLAPMTGGRVVLEGTDVTRRSAERRSQAGIFLIPEDRGLFPPLSVDVHLRLAVRRRPAAAELEEAFGVFPQLATKRGQSAGSLSGGEAQMLSLAMAIIARPSFLLIDELSFGLAPKVVLNLLEICRQIADRGVGVILVEQFVTLALETADRAAVMSSGAISFTGSAAEALADRDAINAAYLGSTTEISV